VQEHISDEFTGWTVIENFSCIFDISAIHGGHVARGHDHMDVGGRVMSGAVTEEVRSDHVDIMNQSSHYIYIHTQYYVSIKLSR